MHAHLLSRPRSQGQLSLQSGQVDEAERHAQSRSSRSPRPAADPRLTPPPCLAPRSQSRFGDALHNAEALGGPSSVSVGCALLLHPPALSRHAPATRRDARISHPRTPASPPGLCIRLSAQDGARPVRGRVHGARGGGGAAAGGKRRRRRRPHLRGALPEGPLDPGASPRGSSATPVAACNSGEVVTLALSPGLPCSLRASPWRAREALDARSTS